MHAYGNLWGLHVPVRIDAAAGEYRGTGATASHTVAGGLIFQTSMSGGIVSQPDMHVYG
jgi:hypothetical protein